MHCLVRFHELVIRHADMVLTHGVTPSVCHVLAVPAPVPFAPGILSFIEDTGNEVHFKDCAINRATLKPVETTRGIRLVIQIHDRRWRWKYRRISGEYNQMRRDATFQGNFKKTYRELLEILLESLGETSYEIELPRDDLEGIHVCWQNARADLELAKLLDKIGCIVTLGLDDKVKILVNGTGTEYGDTLREKMPLIDTTPSTIPAKVVVQFQDTRVQCPLQLRAVGLQSDRDIKPLEDLDYAPIQGWDRTAPDYYPWLDVKEQFLARRSVFKWYQVDVVRDDVSTLTLPDGPTVDTDLDVERIMPLEEPLLEHPSEFLSMPSKAYITGTLWLGDLAGVDAENATDTEAFVLDCERGLVYFQHCVMQVNADTVDVVPDEADIALVCPFKVRDEQTNQYHCYKYSLDTGTNADEEAGEAVVLVPDRYLWYRYDIDDEEWTDNLTEIDEFAKLLAESFVKSFANIPQAEQEWVGLTPFPVQGNIHMMRWVVSADRCLTYGFKNVESGLLAPIHHERRMREITEGLLT